MPESRDAALPRTLSGVGAFANVAALQPVSGLVAYDVNTPFWSDGASKSRWIGLPAGRHFQFMAEGEWMFPAGTVLVKHFELPRKESDPDGPRTRLETRVLVCDGEGGAYGACYKWRKDGSDADLVTEPLNAAAAQSWYFPGVSDCRTCHTSVSGGVLGVKTRQINRPFGASKENQLTAWRRKGFFGPATPPMDTDRLAKLSPLDDVSRPIEDRARSFLDVNCAYCHRPGGVAGNFDARYDTPPDRQNLIGGAVLIDLGIDRARVIAPHDVWRSLALVRVSTSDLTRMPPLAHQKVDERGVSVLRAWIESLPGPAVVPPPSVEPTGGEFAKTIRVVLSDREAGAVVRYTLDGSLPVATSPVYQGPVEIKGPATLRARAFKEGMTRSIVVQETYIVND
jgi:hypothetical protein